MASRASIVQPDASGDGGRGVGGGNGRLHGGPTVRVDDIQAFLRASWAQLLEAPQQSKLDILISLEKTDENFHRHTLVRRLQKKIEETMSPLLDFYLQDSIDHGGSSDPAFMPNLIDKLLTSQQYLSLVSNVMSETRAAVADLLQRPSFLTPSAPSPTHQEWSFSTHSGVTCESSSGSLSSFSPSSDDMRSILKSLVAKNSVDVRLAGAKKLEALPAADLLGSEVWLDVKSSIETALADNDQRISLCALNICTRIFRASPPPMTGDVYLILVNHLTHVFESGQLSFPAAGINVKEPRWDLLLRKFALLHHFHLDLPTCWIRFTDQTLTDILDATFRLLRPRKSRLPSSMSTTQLPLTALHCISLIDPRAKWFEKWMLSQVGRERGVKSMGKAGLVEALAELVVEGAGELMASASDGGDERDLEVGRGLRRAGALSARTRLAGSSAATAPGRDEVVVMDVDTNDEDAPTETVDAVIAVEDLEYVRFVHTITMLAKVASCSAGRHCFPIMLTPSVLNSVAKAVTNVLEKHSSTQETPMRLEDFLKILMKLVINCPALNLSKHFDSNAQAAEHDSLRLPKIICDIFKSMVSEPKCQERLLKAGLLEAFVPLMGSFSLENPTSTETVLKDLGEVLQSLASTDTGRRALLGDFHSYTVSTAAGDWSDRSRPALGEIVTLVVRGLDGDRAFWKSGAAVTVNNLDRSTLATFIFLLRQLYRTCHGLMRLERFNLHRAIADNLKAVTERVASDTSIHVAAKEWKTVLIDNLLNFAGTPKGMMYLFESKSMEACVAHMFHRYQKKMQVSPCEKFGYGVLVSQISTTPPGMHALAASGILDTFIDSAWTSLIADRSPYGNYAHFDLDDPENHKILSNLMKAYSSFSGLKTALEMEESEGKWLKRGTLSHLIRKMALVDRPLQEEGLVLFDESHQIGLRLLHVLASSLDSFHLLQAKFDLHKSLLRLQSDSRTPNGSYIIDDHSLRRNSILVETACMGGQKERHVPNATEANASIRMFSSLPVPDEYFPSVNYSRIESSTANEFAEILEFTTSKDASAASWFQKAQETFASFIRDSPEKCVPLPVLADLLKKALCLVSESEENLTQMGWTRVGSADDLETSPRNARDQGGLEESVERPVAKMLRFIKRILPGLHSSTPRKSLVDVLLYCQALVSRGQAKPAKKTFDGFDWFAAVAFTVFGGRVDACCEFLRLLSCYLPSMLLWPKRSQLTRMDIPIIYSCSSYLVEALLESEAVPVFSAFTLSGCTPSQITQRWLRECFLNVLAFPEIANYLALTLLFGVDYQVYFCIAALRFCQPAIQQAARRGELIVFLNEAAGIRSVLGGFRAADHLAYMRDLEGRYREVVFSELRSQVA
ncbi:broad-minded protein-domain-containing protein [Zopfochytrium polystomum]|nr:broad-minded protein-domain-containing protein [Zopfochytrium polystomum]